MNAATILNHPMFYFAVAFCASLLATVILFYFLKSTAEIVNPKFRAGGALAGFIIIFYISYNSTDKYLQKYLRNDDNKPKLYNIEGFVLLDSSYTHGGTEVMEIPPTLTSYSTKDGFYLLRGVEINPKTTKSIQIGFSHGDSYYQTGIFDSTQFSIDNDKMTIRIHDTVKLRKHPIQSQGDNNQ